MSLRNTISNVILLMFLLLGNSLTASSQTDYDGIELTTVDVQRTSYLYGEPIRMYFYIVNNDNVSKPYAPPSYAVNLKFVLKDQITGRSVSGNEKWNHGLAVTMRNNIINGSTLSPLEIKPKESFYFYPHMGEEFGSEKLSNAQVAKTSNLRFNLDAIPVGKYELTAEYYLYPSNQVLRKSIMFEVKAIPDEMKIIFQKYVQATVYAANTNYWAGRNYEAKHPNSYENFVNDNPDNIFANYAVLDMVSQIYAYKLLSEPGVKETLNEFTEYGSEITEKDLKVTYGVHIPHVVSQLYGADRTSLKSSTNTVLKEMLNDSPEASSLLIQLSASRNKLTGLTNYATKDLK